MTRTATVQTVSRVSLPDSDEDAWEVRTDLAEVTERAFYLAYPGPKPAESAVVTWDSLHATWVEDGREVVGRKVGYGFDADAMLS